jgi:hypothetical protein
MAELVERENPSTQCPENAREGKDEQFEAEPVEDLFQQNMLGNRSASFRKSRSKPYGGSAPRCNRNSEHGLSQASPRTNAPITNHALYFERQKSPNTAAFRAVAVRWVPPEQALKAVRHSPVAMPKSETSTKGRN